MKQEEQPEDGINAAQRERIDGFKKRFDKKTSEQLEEMAYNDALLPEATMAALEILDSRKA